MNFITRKRCKEQGLQTGKDYEVYRFDPRENVKSFSEGMLFNAVIAFLFYDSAAAMLPGMTLVFLYRREKKKQLLRKRKHQMREDLRTFLNALIAALQTGRSIENAFDAAWKDTARYTGETTDFIEEMKKICAGVLVGQPLEKLLMDFAVRSHMEELEYFSEVFRVGKRSGGNLIGILKNTIRMLQERMEAEEEIYTVVSQARLEFYIMCIVPLAILVYLRVTAGGFLDSLYGNLTGVFLMTICLIIYGGCYFYGKRLLEIKN